MTINSLEIVNKIEGNKKAISFFLKNLNITYDANIWMINGSKGIGKSFLAKLIASNLLANKFDAINFARKDFPIPFEPFIIHILAS